LAKQGIFEVVVPEVYELANWLAERARFEPAVQSSNSQFEDPKIETSSGQPRHTLSRFRLRTDRTSFAPETTTMKQNERGRIQSKTRENQRRRPLSGRS
jgi:hypothetical protein